MGAGSRVSGLGKRETPLDPGVWDPTPGPENLAVSDGDSK